jgi:hypothetical protein
MSYISPYPVPALRKAICGEVRKGKRGGTNYPRSANHGASPGFPGGIIGFFSFQAAVRAHFVRVLTIDVVGTFWLGVACGKLELCHGARTGGSMVFPDRRDGWDIGYWIFCGPISSIFWSILISGTLSFLHKRQILPLLKNISNQKSSFMAQRQYSLLKS